MQTTLVIFKPDCILRGLVGEILARFEKRGLKIVGLKKMKLSNEILEEHYEHLKDKPFFPGIVKAMQRTPVIVLALQGVDAAEVARKMAGATNARAAEVGTIRGDLAVSIQNNLVHISDSPESAEIEVERFFKKEELIDPTEEELGVIYSPDERG
ncbi:MAG: nucleoside-diphosphate kinase [Patescibacteria group bacterium]